MICVTGVAITDFKLEHLKEVGIVSQVCSTVNLTDHFQIAFSDWINTNLATDKDVQHLLPLSTDGRDLYQKITNGILLM